MEGKRFDHLAKAVAQSSSRRRVLGAVLVGVLGSLRLRATAAADTGPDIAAAGNGGVATASANGGAVGIGNINSGGNAGNAIGVGDTVGSVGVAGGDVGNATGITVTADGGTGIADASGGDNNLAAVVDPPTQRNEPERDQDHDHNHDHDKDNDKDKDKGGGGGVCPGTAAYCCECVQGRCTTDLPGAQGGPFDVSQQGCDNACDANPGVSDFQTAGSNEGFTCGEGTCNLVTC